MRKTFGSAFALIMVALLTVAPTSPATAYPGGIHLHIAGKVGQKAVGSTVIFGAEGLTEAPQLFAKVGTEITYTGLTPNACLWLQQGNQYGEWEDLEPAISGWGECSGIISSSESAKNFQIPASGSRADQIPLPDLPAGKYQMLFAAWPSFNVSTSVSLGVAFTIGADGTFTAIGPACDGPTDLFGQCMPGFAIPLPAP
ncbi:MAG: hypothetical protein QNL53_05100 [Microbacteriaceae bacterium]